MVRVASASKDREWYTVKEVADRFGKSTETVRVAANESRLNHDVVLRGGRKERRFPKAVIDGLAEWPGYGARPVTGSTDTYLVAEAPRQRDEKTALRREVEQLRVAGAAAEMKIDELRRTVDRQQVALRGLVEALAGDEFDMAKLQRLLS